MIISRQKDLTALFKGLSSDGAFFVIGCGKCAEKLRVGGHREVEEISHRLVERGLRVVGSHVISTACSINSLEETVSEMPEIDDATILLAMACGNGMSMISKASQMKTLPVLDTTSIGGVCHGYIIHEQCAACAECNTHLYHGLCPTTQSPKGLQNGPCGGSINGSCEVGSEWSCVWSQIYEEAEKCGSLRVFTEFHPPKDHSKKVRREGILEKI